MAKATREEALRGTEEIRMFFDSYSSSYYKLGKAVKKGLDQDFAEAIGMSVGDWMANCARGIGKSVATIYKAVRIVTALPDLTPEQIAKLPEGNAYALTLLPESKRLSEEWLEKAKTMDKESFKAEVDKLLGRDSKPEQWFECFPKLPVSVKPIADEVKRVMAEQIFQFDPDDGKKFIGVLEKILVSFYQDFQTPEGIESVRVWLVGEDENTVPAGFRGFDRSIMP
jgi:hypothetical protein